MLITSDGVVKVLDFGLAKLAGQVKLTREGTTMGTVCLLYTSPSPRDGHLSIRRQRQMCNKRQYAHHVRRCGEGPGLRPGEARRPGQADPRGNNHGHGLSLIHISEPTRRTPLYSSAASDV